MFKKILEGNTYYWLAFHVILGLASGFNRIIAIGWIYLLIFSTILTVFNPKKKNDVLHYFFAYYVTFEIFGRILRLTPYIPVESGKYLAFFLLLLGLAAKCHNTKNYKVNFTGIIICLLSIPSIALMRQEDFLDHLVFNWMGIFDLGLFVIYFSNYVFSKEDVVNLFKLILFPLVSISFYLLIYTPSIDELSFNIGANSAASGHFGPNQVSSVFGAGIFILGAALILNYRVFKNYFVDVILLLLFVVRGFLTLSRGGVFSAILALVVVFLLGKGKSAKQSASKIFAVLFLGVIIFFVFNYINQKTGDSLLGRYEGQTLETKSGGKEKDLESVTDGRSSIFFAELNIFSQHPVLGVGPGQSRYYWDLEFDGESPASHTEFSRLLAEHGMLGLTICLLLFSPLFLYWAKRTALKKRGFAYYLNLAYLVFALSMASHSAMRTMLTPFFFGLGFAGMRTMRDDTVRVEASAEVIEDVPVPAL